jgi:hypothetical protein
MKDNENEERKARAGVAVVRERESMSEAFIHLPLQGSGRDSFIFCMQKLNFKATVTRAGRTGA